MLDEYKIAFSLIGGMGVKFGRLMLDCVGTEREFFAKSSAELERLFSRRNKILDAGYRQSLLATARAELEFMSEHGVRARYFTDDDFPRRLLEADDAPVLLYSFGPADLNSEHVISIVGTRHATLYGRSAVGRILQEVKLSFPDTVVVSGLAFGIDVAAHRAAMECGLPTVAVVAHGLNTIYPASHREVARDILRKGGAIVSDYTSQSVLHRGNFLARNRIIAALADCTIVAESAAKGGAMVTAAIAGSYNRDVCAIPGRIGDTYSEGCNALIKRNKAAMITSADDLFEALRWEKPVPAGTQASLFPQYEYTPEEAKIVSFLTDRGTAHLNDIATALNRPVHKLLAVLVEMEFKQLLEALPGSRFTLAH